MNLTAIIAALEAAGNLIGGAGAQQFVQLMVAFVNAIPSIEKGIMSAEPFVMAAITLIRTGGTPDEAAWAAQLANLQAQTDAIDQQVAADEAAQPGS